MRNVIASLIGLVALGATAETVILYDDGSQYTVKDSEHVYVSNYRKLYQMKQYSKGDIKLNKVLPSDKRDYVSAVEPVGAVGSHEWCESYEPWSEGLTFTQVNWNLACDVNGDGEYNMCDYYEPTGIPSFEEMEWQDRCNDGEPWDGS
jgi:hypothetical protein